MSNVICLGGSVESKPMIHHVQAMGHRAVVVDGNRNAPARDIVDRFCAASCYDGYEAIVELRRIGEHYDAVLCCGVDAPVTCAEIAHEFGLIGLTVNAAKLGQNKYAQKIELSRAGIPVPEFAFVMYGAGSSVLKSGAGRVIKPIDSRGGRGVIRLLDGVDIAWAYEQAKAQSPTGRVMVEQWLDGQQLSTESIVQDGKVLFTAIGLRNYDRLDEFAPFCIEDGFQEPYNYESDNWYRLDDNVSVVIESACRALNWYQQGAGTVKGDLVIHNGRVYVIELACRLSGGFFSTHGHPRAYGVDFIGAAIRAALGERLDLWQYQPKNYVCQRYVFPQSEQVGKTIKRIGRSSTLGFFTWNIKAGDKVEPVTCHPRRWGQTIETGKSSDEAMRKAEFAAEIMWRLVETE